MELLDAVWFDSQGHCLGIIVCIDVTSRKLKSYIGRGSGLNEAHDAVSIMEWGAPFPIESAMSLFGSSLNSKGFINDQELASCYLSLMMSCGRQIERHFETTKEIE